MKYEIEYVNATEYRTVFSNGDTHFLREYYNCDTNESGIEVWDEENKTCLYEIPGASLLDLGDSDAENYNQRELEYIENY